MDLAPIGGDGPRIGTKHESQTEDDDASRAWDLQLRLQVVMNNEEAEGIFHIPFDPWHKNWPLRRLPRPSTSHH